MSILNYGRLAPNFLALLSRSSPVFAQDPLNATHFLISDEVSGRALGGIIATIGAGRLTALSFSDAAERFVGNATGLSADAAAFGTALANAGTGAERLALFVSLIDDNTQVNGSVGDDIIETGAGNDIVNAGGGNDDVNKWKKGNLTYDGGNGIDLVHFDTRGGAPFPTPFAEQLIADLSGATVGRNPYGGRVTLHNVENIVGTPRADRIAGSDSANRIGDGRLDQGADTVAAGGGDDIVRLGANSAGASVDGGSGRDELSFNIDDESGSDSGVTVLDLLAPTANDGALLGTSVARFEIFTVDNSVATPSSFVFRGDNKANTVTGVKAEPGAAIANGVDALFGRGGNDTLNGLSGVDRLDGGTGNDALNGGAGNDAITGGDGRDAMTGASGRDFFVFTATSETGKTAATRDFIRDFTQSQADRIALSRIDADPFVAGDQAFIFRGADDFTGTAGELRFGRVDLAGTANDITLIEIDLNGDASVDNRIGLKGLIVLVAGDFLL